MDHLKINNISCQITIYILTSLGLLQSLPKTRQTNFQVETILEDNEKIWFSKICPNFVVSAVIKRE